MAAEHLAPSYWIAMPTPHNQLTRNDNSILFPLSALTQIIGSLLVGEPTPPAIGVAGNQQRRTRFFFLDNGNISKKNLDLFRTARFIFEIDVSYKFFT